ncbi:MAG: transporter [Chloroflexi bacterium GWB2_49_20]|nr:MAG: transporter [Chloroflexi bacterium GWB2_49_20]OGN78197.1 MAG: transporter [Chloroflexi bacterium GWC2_49_37]OGN85233.1 MAG: transporter [Chloroflexi bacterium GWD2_49_16]
MNDKKQFRYFDIIMAVFVTILVVSNIASSAKIVDWGVNLFGLKDVRLAFDAGTLLFPISYIFGDVLTEVYGYRRSRKVIWTGFACLSLSAFVFWIIKLLPGEATWQVYAGDAAYLAILGGMSSGGIVLASLIGFWTGEFTNSYTLAKMKIWTEGKFLWTRTIGSTIVGEFVDTFVFVIIACLFGVFPWSLFWSLTITNYLFKCGIEGLMTPLTYKIVNKLKKVESEDYYDRDTDFNPFIL